MSQTYNVAVIAGDGIGKEVMPEGLKIVKAAADKFGLNIEFHTFEWGGCDYYETHGKMMPDDWKDQVADMGVTAPVASRFEQRPVPAHRPASVAGVQIRYRNRSR